MLPFKGLVYKTLVVLHFVLMAMSSALYASDNAVVKADPALGSGCDFSKVKAMIIRGFTQDPYTKSIYSELVEHGAKASLEKDRFKRDGLNFLDPPTPPPTAPDFFKTLSFNDRFNQAVQKFAVTELWQGPAQKISPAHVSELLFSIKKWHNEGAPDKTDRRRKLVHFVQEEFMLPGSVEYLPQVEAVLLVHQFLHFPDPAFERKIKEQIAKPFGWGQRVLTKIKSWVGKQKTFSPAQPLHTEFIYAMLVKGFLPFKSIHDVKNFMIGIERLSPENKKDILGMRFELAHSEQDFALLLRGLCSDVTFSQYLGQSVDLKVFHAAMQKRSALRVFAEFVRSKDDTAHSFVYSNSEKEWFIKLLPQLANSKSFFKDLTGISIDSVAREKLLAPEVHPLPEELKIILWPEVVKGMQDRAGRELTSKSNYTAIEEFLLSLSKIETLFKPASIKERIVVPEIGNLIFDSSRTMKEATELYKKLAKKYWDFHLPDFRSLSFIVFDFKDDLIQKRHFDVFEKIIHSDEDLDLLEKGIGLALVKLREKRKRFDSWTKFVEFARSQKEKVSAADLRQAVEKFDPSVTDLRSARYDDEVFLLWPQFDPEFKTVKTAEDAKTCLMFSDWERPEALIQKIEKLAVGKDRRDLVLLTASWVLKRNDADIGRLTTDLVRYFRDPKFREEVVIAFQPLYSRVQVKDFYANAIKTWITNFSLEEQISIFTYNYLSIEKASPEGLQMLKRSDVKKLIEVIDKGIEEKLKNANFKNVKDLNEFFFNAAHYLVKISPDFKGIDYVKHSKLLEKLVQTVNSAEEVSDLIQHVFSANNSLLTSQFSALFSTLLVKRPGLVTADMLVAWFEQIYQFAKENGRDVNFSNIFNDSLIYWKGSEEENRILRLGIRRIQDRLNAKGLAGVSYAIDFTPLLNSIFNPKDKAAAGVINIEQSRDPQKSLAVADSQSAAVIPVATLRPPVVHQPETLINPATDATLAPPSYKFIRPLGSGATSNVYEVEWAGRKWALKIVNPERREMVANGVKHANMIWDKASDAEKKYFVYVFLHQLTDTTKPMQVLMEMVDGPSLRQIITPHQKTGLPIADAISWARQIAEGLSVAHRIGMPHREIRPENILVTKEGQIKLVDPSGVVFDMDKNAGAVNVQSFAKSYVAGQLGVHYTTSEEYYDKPDSMKDLKSDVYAVGVTLREMLTGVLSKSKVSLSREMGRRDVHKEAMKKLPPELLSELQSLYDDTQNPSIDRISLEDLLQRIRDFEAKLKTYGFYASHTPLVDNATKPVMVSGWDEQFKPKPAKVEESRPNIEPAEAVASAPAIAEKGKEEAKQPEKTFETVELHDVEGDNIADSMANERSSASKDHKKESTKKPEFDR